MLSLDTKTPIYTINTISTDFLLENLKDSTEGEDRRKNSAPNCPFRQIFPIFQIPLKNLLSEFHLTWTNSTEKLASNSAKGQKNHFNYCWSVQGISEKFTNTKLLIKRYSSMGRGGGGGGQVVSVHTFYSDDPS